MEVAILVLAPRSVKNVTARYKLGSYAGEAGR
jgi:hypothetical protein